MAFPVVPLAKLGVMAATHHGLTPLVTALLWPFLLKFSFSFRPLHQGCADMMYSVRLFIFQMGQIAFDTEPSGGAAAVGMRWRRALRLVYQRVAHVRHAQSNASGEESLVALSMLAL
ncbi:hypothetical protein CDL12_29742 [Handroanthus impetiginosus]|uniref:Uncharacterized protein n=1 Tax=Handroanthus impetiginosus TaxID=429701 RepID=A0A2G9FXJ4_9LAMI|nr:hypothetical protein CDL12_29742 [Handroanthus impetiginosus]